MKFNTCSLFKCINFLTDEINSATRRLEFCFEFRLEFWLKKVSEGVQNNVLQLLSKFFRFEMDQNSTSLKVDQNCNLTR